MMLTFPPDDEIIGGKISVDCFTIEINTKKEREREGESIRLRRSSVSVVAASAEKVFGALMKRLLHN